MNYFDQTQTGRSVWWSWIFGTWIAMIIWVLGQSILIEFMTGLAGQIDPSLQSAFEENANNMLPVENIEQYFSLVRYATLIAMASIIGMIVTLVISNQGLKTAISRDVFGGDYKPPHDPKTTILAAFTVLSILLAIGLFNHSNSLINTSGSMDLMQRAMGLSPLTYGLFLLTFPVGCFGLYLAQKAVHRRSLMSLHTAAKTIKWWRIFEGFLISWIVIGSLMLIVSQLGLVDIRVVFNRQTFWGFALVSLLLIPLQSGTEEIVVRGYFNQGLTHIFRNKWIAFAITSLGFMALHLSNPEALEGAASGTLPIVMSMPAIIVSLLYS